MNADNPPERCRLVLIAPAGLDASRLEAALSGGDVASLIIPAEEAPGFEGRAGELVRMAQAHGAAAIIEGDGDLAERLGADGIHVEAKKHALAATIEGLGGRLMVGAGGAKTRDDALELGETRPDYLFFGRFGYDAKPDPHHRNLSLGGWWAEMIEIPCIVMGGADLETLPLVAATGAEFAALSAAIFGEGVDPGAAVTRANAILDEFSPRFET